MRGKFQEKKLNERLRKCRGLQVIGNERIEMNEGTCIKETKLALHSKRVVNHDIIIKGFKISRDKTFWKIQNKIN